MPSKPVSSALALARARAAAPLVATAPDGVPRERALAMGDPQAPLSTVLGVLDRHGALGRDGLIRPEVLLVSVGDHFDWGSTSSRTQTTSDCTALLSWLACHPPDQVVLLAGNHDLARVGELASIDSDTYEAARDAATRIYRKGKTSPQQEAAFRVQFPNFPTAEAAARDLSAFSVAQRSLVLSLLRAGRLRLAWAASASVLVNHAGVTGDDLALLGLPPEDWSDARVVADALNRALDAAVAGWQGEPLHIAGLHTPGNAAIGEGGGILFHRPANPALGSEAAFVGPTRRRYDPRRLPRGLTQVVGHVRDAKSRALLGPWCDDARPMDGVLRHLRTDGASVSYRHGVPAREEPGTATLLFIDAGMQHVGPGGYPLLDLRSLAAAQVD